MSLESTPIEEAAVIPESQLEQLPQQPAEAAAFAERPDTSMQWNAFTAERDTTMNRINELHQELGLLPTTELPVHLARQEEKLKALDTHEDEYVDFEMVDEPKREANQEKEAIKQKLQSFYSEIENLPMVEYRSIASTGYYASGQLFHSGSFGTLSAEQIRRMVSFYENNQVVDDAVAEEFIETVEPEVLDAPELPAYEEAAEQVPEQKLLEEHPAEAVPAE